MLNSFVLIYCCLRFLGLLFQWGEWSREDSSRQVHNGLHRQSVRRWPQSPGMYAMQVLENLGLCLLLHCKLNE